MVTRSQGPHAAQTSTLSLRGLEASMVRVEATASAGPATFQLLGVSEARVRECRVRVRAALQQVGVDLTAFTITVQLEPADAPGSGAFDVAIAVAVLGALGHVSTDALAGTVLLGELSLTGALRPVRGVLPALRGAILHGVTCAIVPRSNAREAACVRGIRVLVADHLGEIVGYLKEGTPLEGTGEPPPFPPLPSPASPDLEDIRGLHSARRALEIAAAGGHPLLLVGPPGAGKTMLARRLPGLLPPPSLDEAMEISALHSVAGLLKPEEGLLATRPFRAPHHTVSAAGLGGGGDPVRPGEVSLAHHGVLFLDEILEFRTSVLDVLREPLEDGCVTLCRSRSRTVFPARPLVVAAVNPCPCGYAGNRTNRCTCSTARLETHRKRVAGSFAARFDLHIILPPVDVIQLQGTARGEPSREVQKRVIAARAFQAERKQQELNSRLSGRDLERLGKLEAAGASVLAQAIERRGLSAATHAQVLRVARTIADLDASEGVRSLHIAEAIEAIAFSAPATPTAR